VVHNRSHCIKDLEMSARLQRHHNHNVNCVGSISLQFQGLEYSSALLGLLYLHSSSWLLNSQVDLYELMFLDRKIEFHTNSCFSKLSWTNMNLFIYHTWLSLIKRQHHNQYHVIHCRVSTFLFPLSASLQNEAVFAISESHVVRSCESHWIAWYEFSHGCIHKRTCGSWFLNVAYVICFYLTMSFLLIMYLMVHGSK